ncbi:hypothetical protein DSCO28_72930 (plasmid) [Desulfosarcina ovata subsp. sediminis]|uniref:MobA/MobL protein domain-containing protein n=2 Tax=Desulfosarcina ovata TaxID=83564 RepID=A0A5K8A2K3_9BACT|nr:hypothetical protein DSCO28_72930 [Desulfosarcina ovata subsp. sediminis]
MRELEGALPIELDKEIHVKIVREFCQKHFTSKGMIADICIHSNGVNPHVHISLTMRKVEGEGFGKKERSWNSKEYLKLWREEWANVQNLHLAKAGLDVRVDHRSFKDQGVDLKPQVKIGVAVHGDPEQILERTEEYQRIATENGERIIEDPIIALDHITKYQSTFTHEDILKYVHSHCDDAQFYAAVDAILTSQELVKIEENEYDRFDRYTTLGLLETEKRLSGNATELNAIQTHTVSEKSVSKSDRVKKLSDEQQGVLEQILGGKDIHVVVGDAGTGKSFTLDAVRDVYERSGYTITGMALAGVAAEGLENSSGIKSSTVARKFLDWDNGRELLDEKSVLVVDEAGMIGTRQMDRIVNYVREAGAKLILVGDTKQAQAVEAGGAFRLMIERTIVSRLRYVWRQNEDWQKEATKLFAGDSFDIGKATDMYKENGCVSEHDTLDEAEKVMISDYVDLYNPDTTSIMTTHMNEDVDRLNWRCREQLKTHTNILDNDDVAINTSRGRKNFCAGDRILFLRNEKSIGVKNGTFGTIQAVSIDGVLNVFTDNQKTVRVDSHFYNNFTHGYAATIYKLQGATIDRTFFLASDGIDRHTGYVAMSRHRDQVNLYYSRDKYQNYEDLKRKLANVGEKELLGDYELKNISVIEEEQYRLTSKEATFTTEDGDIEHYMIEVGTGNDGKMHYSTTEMIAAERSMFDVANAMGFSRRNALEDGTADKIIADVGLDEKQAFVLKRVLSGSDLCLVDYQYGTDRSHLGNAIARAYHDKGYIVEGLSISGLRALSLEKESGIKSMTIAKKLWEWENARNLLSEKSVLIIDNANMIDTRQTERIVRHAENTGAKVVMFGNEQTPLPFNAGGAFRGIKEHTGVTRVTLQRSDKKELTFLAEAVDLLKGNWHDADRAVDLLAEQGCIAKHDDIGSARLAVVEEWFEDVRAIESYHGRSMIALSNKDVDALNEVARSRLKYIGWVDIKDTAVKTAERGDLEFAAGDRVMFLRKDNGMGVQSGSLGTLRNIAGNIMTVHVDGGETISFDTRLYNDLAHGYAVTVHRSAGMSLQNVYILTHKHFNQNVTKAALQAGKENARLHHSFRNHNELKKHLSRPVEKELVADYPKKDEHYLITVNVGEKTFHKVVHPSIGMTETAKAAYVREKARRFAAAKVPENATPGDYSINSRPTDFERHTINGAYMVGSVEMHRGMSFDVPTALTDREKKEALENEADKFRKYHTVGDGLNKAEAAGFSIRIDNELIADSAKREGHYLIKLIMPIGTRYKVVQPPVGVDKKTIDAFLRKEAALFDDRERPKDVSASDAKIKFQKTDLTRHTITAVYIKERVEKERETTFDVATALPASERNSFIRGEAEKFRDYCIARDGLGRKDSEGLSIRFDGKDLSMEASRRKDHYLIKLVMPIGTRYKMVQPPVGADKKAIDAFLRKEAALFDDRERPKDVSASDAQIKFQKTDLIRYRITATYMSGLVEMRRETTVDVATALPEAEQKAIIENEAFLLKKDCVLRDKLNMEETRNISFAYYKQDDSDRTLEEDKGLDHSRGMEL